MPETDSITFRAESDLVKRLEKLVAATDRTKSWHVEQALKDYLGVQAWQIEQTEKGLDDLVAGRVINHEKVAAWLENWGRPNEGDAPL